MKYLNLGCGYHYSTQAAWANIDFASTGPGVAAHNLLQGIPYDDNSFDLVYHSHVLEHFSREDGDRLIRECFRVLKPNGVLRIAVPDLESIARNYIKFLEAGVEDPGNENIRANYEWMLLEMYDQTVRNKPGGNMGGYLSAEKMANENFVFSRIGEEGRAYRKMALAAKNKIASATITPAEPGIKEKIKNTLLQFLRVDQKQFEMGKFRSEGEIHQWMYDRYSLATLLQKYGGSDISVRDAFTSYITEWSGYGLDAIDNQVRKPDSLFMEAIKK